MQRTVLFVCGLLIASVSSYAQELTALNGTWISARFMEGLKKSHSVVWAMNDLPDNVPLWLSIDTTHNKLHANAAYGFGDTITLRMFQATLGELGKRWAIGETSEPRWMITADVPGAQFVALHWLDSLEVNPIVLSKLPTRRTDPDFLLDRMIISAMLTGMWTDTSGRTYEFKRDATVNWHGTLREVEIDVNPKTLDVFMSLVDRRGNVEQFQIARNGSNLTITNVHGVPMVLTMVSTNLH